MVRRRQHRPTDAELAILRALWDHGPCTVREVHDLVSATTATKDRVGYTTILKTMQIMTEKELVVRDERERAHVYRAKRSEHDTQRQLVRDLADRAFEGSASKLAR